METPASVQTSTGMESEFTVDLEETKKKIGEFNKWREERVLKLKGEIAWKDLAL